MEKEIQEKKATDIQKELKVMHLIRSPQEIQNLGYIAPYRIVSGLTPYFQKKGIQNNIFIIGQDNYSGKDNHNQPLESIKSDIVIKHAKGDFDDITKQNYIDEGEQILFPALREQIEKYKPDVILVQNPLFSEIYALKRVKSYLENSPKIVDYCGCSPFKMKLSGEKMGGLEILIENKNVFDGHVSMSNFVKNFLKEEGIDSDMIYAGINLEDFNFEKPSTDSEKIVMYSGRFHPDKGAQYIPEIVGHVMKKARNTKFVLAGYGPLESKMKKRLEKFNGNIHISAMGKPELIKAYFSAHTYFQPSLIEAFCVSSIEAMLAGNNMVYSALKSTALKEVIGNVGTPVTEIDPKRYAEAILENLAKKKIPNEEAIQRVKDNFDIEKKSEEWIDYFEDLVS